MVPRRAPSAHTLALLALLSACGQGAGDEPVDTWADVDVFYYDPDGTPDLEDLGDGDDGGPGDGGPGDGGDGADGGGGDTLYAGSFELEVRGSVSDTCTGTAEVERSGPTVTGAVACTFSGDLSGEGETTGTITGDAGGDGTLTVQLAADPFTGTLTGGFTEADLTLSGGGPNGGGLDGDFTATVDAERVD